MRRLQDAERDVTDPCGCSFPYCAFQSSRALCSRLDEIQAAILRAKLRHLEEWNEKRRYIAGMYNKLINNPLIEKPEEPNYAKNVYHIYVIRCQKRDKLRKYLEEKEIMTQIHYPIPVHLQEAYRDLGLKRGTYTITEEYADEVLSLPMYPELSVEMIETVAVAINEFDVNG